MAMRSISTAAALALGLLFAPRLASAQLSPSAAWGAHAANDYQVFVTIREFLAKHGLGGK